MRNVIKKLLPNLLQKKIKSIIRSFHQTSMPVFAKTPFLAHCYFFLFNRTFYREQFSIIQGMNVYKSRVLTKVGQSNPLLRRNIHRIEKGLIMRPIRPVFALDYIKQTQQAFFLAYQSIEHQQQELQWAQSVLVKFYQTVKVEQNELLQKLSTEFFQLINSVDSELEKQIPYTNKELPSVEISYQQFYQFIQLRRSTRWFKPSTVCREKIKQAVTVASQAPSACNRQSYSFYVIDQQPMLAKVGALAIGGGGFADNIPCLIALVGDYSSYEHERDRHIIYIDASLAAMQFMQTLPTLGLSSCPLNWPELSTVDKKISRLLKLEKHQKTIMLIAVGEAEPEGGIPFSQKKTAEQLIHFVDE